MRKIISKIISSLTASFLLAGSIPMVSVNAETGKTKLIALTFDDGPNTTTTNQVLDVLQEYGAKASFFLIGDNINDESAVSVKRAYDMGMEIDNHSKTHSNMSKMSAEELKAEVDYVDDKVYDIIGEKTKFFRPPFIDVSMSMYEAIEQPFICGIDPRDYMENITAQDRADFILNGAKDGVIVLMHDAAGNSQTVEALKIAIPQLKEQGYEFVTLTELFERQGETPKDYIIYSNVASYPCDNYTFREKIESDAKDRISLNPDTLDKLGDTYAIELEYESATGYPPVVALQKWSGASIWQTVQPFYFNGERAVFLAEDILSELKNLNVSCTDLDGIAVTAYTGDIVLSNAKLLVKSELPETTVKGDVNADGEFTIADIVLLQKWILNTPDVKPADWKAGDLCEDGRLDVFDLCLMKRILIEK